MYELGLGQFTPLDQMFINSLIRITEGVVICLGRNIELPHGKKDSTNLIQVCVGQLVPSLQIPQAGMHWFSRKCMCVLPFTCKGNNFTCSQCIHDINQCIHNLKSTGIISAEEADLLLTKSSKDDKHTTIDLTSDGQEKNSGDSFESPNANLLPAVPRSGAKRVRTPSNISSSEDEEDSESKSEVSIFYFCN